MIIDKPLDTNTLTHSRSVFRVGPKAVQKEQPFPFSPFRFSVSLRKHWPIRAETGYRISCELVIVIERYKAVVNGPAGRCTQRNSGEIAKKHSRDTRWLEVFKWYYAFWATFKWSSFKWAPPKVCWIRSKRQGKAIWENDSLGNTFRRTFRRFSLFAS